MPIKKSHRIRGAKAAVAAVLVAAALPAAASAETTNACPAVPSSQLFLTLGDLNYYFLAPGGDFESRDVWTVTGHYSYEQYDAGALPFAGPQALVLFSGAQATSPAFCVDATDAHLRLGGQTDGGYQGRLAVEAITPDGSAVLLGTLNGPDFKYRALSAEVPLASKLALAPGQTTQVQIRLTATGWWGVDAVSIDPRRAA
jgi:hypothetical protein